MMKILVVEDDNVKSQDIQSVFDIFTDVSVEIQTCTFKAKERLARNHYDLMILDMNLPFEEDGDSQEFAGFMLLKEIQNVQHLKKPGDIIVLTSYDELIKKYEEEIGKGLFVAIKYDVYSVEWKERITNRVNYVMSAANDASDIGETGYDYHCAIITAVDIEFTEAKKILNNPEEFRVKGDPTFYTSGTIGDKKVIIAKQHQMGMTASSVLVMKMIQHFKPKYFIMTGIAAGVKETSNLGDIILASEVWEFSSGKIISGQLENKNFLPDPKYLAISAEIKEVLSKDFSEELKIIEENWENKNNTSGNLKAILGPIACGPVVIQNEQVIKDFIIPFNRKIKGIDMESYGVVYACENGYLPKPRVIICKSICDYGDANKGDTHQNYASYTSAQFTKILLLNHLD
ncbi:phosphorylase family protein [Bacillus thuringiensis]|uniref:phosphorylase family protein n=1 Tax=Bacillus thuringiensis TaxID=1428 RepID=UPI002FFEC222